MQTLKLEDIYTGGDLGRRAQLNFDRLETEEYRPDKVFRDTRYSWPGDWEGRTILGLVLLAQATHLEPKYLEEIMQKLPEKLNENGYMGRVLEEGIFDEQQMSGNSWLLRALIEYYLWKKDDRLFHIIKEMVDHLIKPLKRFVDGYPSRREERIFDGEAMGHLADKRVRNWYISSDIGCLFIMLDGASHAYELLKDPELGQVLDEMIQKFSGIDLAGISFQTHATLSALRGIIRYYENTGKAELLEMAEKIYQLYIEEGITENYSNYNWFGRPTHTEPCAMVDSFIAAFGLWKNTGNEKYLDDAHHIWFNSIEHGQRSNGGFGCDSCSGAGSVFLNSSSQNLYEAYWCCTMRGGEGLAGAAQYSWLMQDDQLLLPFYNESIASVAFTDGEAVIRQSTRYPYEGSTMLEVVRSNVSAVKKIKLFLPLWADASRAQVKINGRKINAAIEKGFVVFETGFAQRTKIEFSFPIELRSKPVMNRHNTQGYHTFRHGTLILGIDHAEQEVGIDGARKLIHQGSGKYLIEDTDIILSPLNDVINMSAPQFLQNRKQILFADRES
ncbi:MAG TPA: hypothetical protein DCY35_12105 [Prolixibacteraceae bacterium]|nr:hypothetical protein [Prolixibacteraceae bacterium]